MENHSFEIDETKSVPKNTAECANLRERILRLAPVKRNLLYRILPVRPDLIDDAIAELEQAGEAGVRICTTSGNEFICDRRRREVRKSVPRTVEQKRKLAALFGVFGHA